MAKAICEDPAVYRFTWPGLDESFICENHVGWLRRVAGAIGLSLQVIKLDNDKGETCRQVVNDG